VAGYLKMRRALGFKLKRHGQVLPQLVAYLDAAGAATLTAELAISWARLPQDVAPINWAHRLGAARGFAAYLKTIDPATEVRVQRALEGLTRGRTALTIAHRMATAEAADEVLVFAAGRLVERGVHADLVALGGRYADMYASWTAQRASRA